MRGVGGPKTLSQLLIANYAITRKSLGPFELDVIEAAVELAPDVAADLDLARVLAKALAEETGAPSVCSLVNELDRFDDVTGGRAALLARELLPVGDRLATAIEAEMPALAGALYNARPVLEDLAKAQWSRAFINDLPDDAFLYIEPGGTKDDAGKTIPRSLRHFPFRDQDGDVDVPHLHNATARIPQSTAAGLTADKKQRLQDRARQLLEQTQDTAEKALARFSLLEKRIPLLKTDEERYVLGVVLEPETVDAQDDIYSAAEVRDAAHRFMEQYRNVGFMHRGLVNERVKILESYLAPTSFSLDGAQVRKGTWLLAVRVLDDELWGQIKNGELTGLSIGGSARRE
ncbi:MAG: XkdF-like putative serine protease domain-containing protein [bacterium]